ncbi:MAG: TIGR01244 family sulfur transferase [Alteraurantiacibacter sp.]
MSAFRKLSDSVWANPQIGEAEIAQAAEEGFTLIVNNRPDGEEPGQPEGGSIAAAAEAAGMRYVAIPVDHSGFSQQQVTAMAEALDGLGESDKALAYCRSGTRSTFLWALARSRAKDDPEALAAAAAEAGYDLSSIRPMMDMLAARED